MPALAYLTNGARILMRRKSGRMTIEFSLCKELFCSSPPLQKGVADPHRPQGCLESILNENAAYLYVEFNLI